MASQLIYTGVVKQNGVIEVPREALEAFGLLDGYVIVRVEKNRMVIEPARSVFSLGD